MHKIIVLSIISVIPFNSFSSDADGMSASCSAEKPPTRSTIKHCPPLYYDAKCGGGLAFTGLKKNEPGEVMPPTPEAQKVPRSPTLGPQAPAQDAKRSRSEHPLAIDKIVPYIMSNPTKNLFADACVNNADKVHCPQLGILLTRDELVNIIQEVQDLTNTSCLLPPNAAGTTQHHTNIVPASLESAETLNYTLLRLVPAESDFKHLTGAYIQDDGNIFMPSLKRIITMDRLLEILTTPEDGEYATPFLSPTLKNIAHEAYQLRLRTPDSAKKVTRHEEHQKSSSAATKERQPVGAEVAVPEKKTKKKGKSRKKRY